ncbi:TPA: hypothetical protein DIS56_01980 [Candidatus Saccharibacteria bacterium]|nr:MAG: ATP synthase subunit delta [Candidatus Saccharibacteria bacterium GW2011_GWA2_46_10]OGL35125.1 MAG: hypothetical protein A3F05_03515 [Candidatus Saccharibacteria bacterium RIFCSPHIGHO2_12_FULL_47_17]HCM51879.1 hypothetical protein [Candidatus Saccharibacteria bacterium]
MTLTFSRRQLADYIIDHLIGRKSRTELSKNVAAALIATKNKKETDLLMEDVAHELENRGLLAHAKVTTATSLTNQLRQQLKTQLKKAVGVKNVILEEEIDKAVIGGVRIETANHTWDKTIARRLADIKEGVRG